MDRKKAPESYGNSTAPSAPSPARHGVCKKDSNRRAACPLPLRGRGILREYSQTRAATGISSGEGSEERPSSLCGRYTSPITNSRTVEARLAGRDGKP